MGARLLQEWLVAPLADRAAIEARLDAVGELLDEHGLRQELREQPRRGVRPAAADRPRQHRPGVAARPGRRRPHPAPAAAHQGQGHGPACRPCCATWRSRLELCPDLREALDAALVDEPPLSPREGGVIRRGYDAELDELHAIARGGKEWIARFQADEITPHRHPQPEGRLQPGLRLLHRDHPHPRQQDPAGLPAQADAQERRALHHAGAEGVRGEGPDGRGEDPPARVRAVPGAARPGGGADAAGCCRRPRCWPRSTCWPPWPSWPSSRQYCRPELCDEPMLEIARRPASGARPDAAAGDVRAQRRAAGRRTTGTLLAHHRTRTWPARAIFIRQVALLTLLAQMGSFVPARQARIGIADRIFTRVGASDELSRGAEHVHGGDDRGGQHPQQRHGRAAW